MGGRYTPSDTPSETETDYTMATGSLEITLEQLRKRAYEDDRRQEAWDQVIEPWLIQMGVKLNTMKEVMKVNYASVGKSVGTQERSDYRAAPADAAEQWWGLFNDSDADGEERIFPHPHDDGPANVPTPVHTPVSSQRTPSAPYTPVS